VPLDESDNKFGPGLPKEKHDEHKRNANENQIKESNSDEVIF
jgi:hypothetical protein